MPQSLGKDLSIDDNRDPNVPLGFSLTKFKKLGEHTDGIQPGFYHLAAESNIGKTAVFTNLALDLLETNPDVSVMYFSLDDARRYTAYRFLSIISLLHINNIQKPKGDVLNYANLLSARNKFLNLIETGRLIVKDLGDLTHIDQLQSTITSFSNLNKLVVFVDGLYNLEVTAAGNQGIRIENIERAQKVKQIVDTYKIPFLSTGELRKKIKSEGKNTKPTLHDLMETGKYAYNANVVWLLSQYSSDQLVVLIP
jgi:replicative DNA helicase